MKQYTDYTKDDLMRLLESLTPGGSEFYESPENCARFIRERKSKPPAAPDLLALLSEIDEALAEWKNLGYISYGSSLMPSRFDSQLERIELRIEEIIAAAKGEAS